MGVGLTERGFICMHRYRFSETDFPFLSEIPCHRVVWGCSLTAIGQLMSFSCIMGELVIMVITTKK